MKQIKINDSAYEFDVIKKLGSGAFASVHLGRCLKTNEPVAIKVIAKDSLQKYGDDIIEAIGSEVNILQEISLACANDPCPFIAGIINCLATANNIYIVLEYCDQGTLEKILKEKKKLPEKEAMLYIYQVALAIDYLAKKNIAHRDLKPENVFMKNGICKLGDFGFASQKNMYNTTLGTYPYMAPEFFNSKSYSLSVDVWALGVMLHQIIFGELYFMGKSQHEVSQLIQNKPYKIIKSDQISKETQDLLQQMLIKDPKKRINAAQMVKHKAFDQIRDHADIQKAYIQRKSLEKLLADDFIYFRNSAFFLVGLAEEFEFNFINECRFEIFFLLKKAVQILQCLLNQLVSKQAYSELITSDLSIWQKFMLDNEYQNCLKIIQNDTLIMQNKFQQFSQTLDLFIQNNYPTKIMEMRAIVNPDINIKIPFQIYTDQLKEGTQLFSQKISQLKDISSKQAQQLYLIIYMLEVASKIDYLSKGHLIDFESFNQKKKNLTIDDIFNLHDRIK